MTENLTQAVKDSYGAVARAGRSSDEDGISTIAKAFGYSDDELGSIPAEANMGLSCGNPTAMASLKEGEVVVDLGAGGGLDVFLAAKAVGPTGKAIGIDMTEDMVTLARKNAEKGQYTNTEFHLAEIGAMPLADNSVDCIISNCVLNLVEDKDAALREIFRVLKPGGRLAVSDIALKGELPEAIAQETRSYVACISGAIPIDDNRSKLEAAGFGAVDIIDSKSDLNVYKEASGSDCCGPAEPAPEAITSCCGPAPAKTDTAYHDEMMALTEEFDFNDYAASVKIFAIKPGT